MKFSDIDILKFGHTIQISGLVLSGEGHHYFTTFPDEPMFLPERFIEMDLEDWEKFLYQSDVLETIVENPEKAIVRKSQRQIDQNVAWAVFKRDGYSCRYCKRDDVPLTVDHVVLWEKGGPTTQDNLVSACRRCNRDRGRMDFAEWIVKNRLTDPFLLDILRNIPNIPVLENSKKRSR